jgi:uncharacterized protein
MHTVTPHAPGTFCWPELAATDAQAAIGFYTKLFGWTVREAPMDAGAYYLFERDGRTAAAMFELSPAMREQGMPVQWASYVAVESTDEAVKRAQAAGGRLLMGPFDVAQEGRMAVIADPLGATFALWQARRNPGIAIQGAVGSLGWTQLNARDPEAAKAFYPVVLGWTHQDAPMGPGVTYTTWHRADGIAGGMMPMPPDVPADARSHWLPYFVVAEVDAAHALAVSLGGKSIVPPSGIPGGGRFAVLGDAQGAFFGVMSV